GGRAPGRALPQPRPSLREPAGGAHRRRGAPAPDQPARARPGPGRGLSGRRDHGRGRRRRRPDRQRGRGRGDRPGADLPRPHAVRLPAVAVTVPRVGARSPRTWAIVVAAGSGARFGGPKQFQLLGGRTVLERSIEGARAVAERVVAVVPPEGGPAPGADVTVPGGATRSDSVRAGLSAVPEDVAVVVVHDAARPLA